MALVEFAVLYWKQILMWGALSWVTACLVLILFEALLLTETGLIMVDKLHDWTSSSYMLWLHAVKNKIRQEALVVNGHHSWCHILIWCKEHIFSLWVSACSRLNHQCSDWCLKITLTSFWLLWTSSPSDHKMKHKGQKWAFNFEEYTILSWVTSQCLLCKRPKYYTVYFDGKCHWQN